MPSDCYHACDCACVCRARIEKVEVVPKIFKGIQAKLDELKKENKKILAENESLKAKIKIITKEKEDLKVTKKSLINSLVEELKQKQADL